MCVFVNADGDKLLDAEAITDTDGKQMADEGVTGVDEDSIKKLKEKGKTLRNQLDAAEVKKKHPPKGAKHSVNMVEEDFRDDIPGVEDIKVRCGMPFDIGLGIDTIRYACAQERMQKVLEKRKADAQERAGSSQPKDCYPRT